MLLLFWLILGNRRNVSEKHNDNDKTDKKGDNSDGGGGDASGGAEEVLYPWINVMAEGVTNRK